MIILLSSTAGKEQGDSGGGGGGSEGHEKQHLQPQKVTTPLGQNVHLRGYTPT